MVTYNVGLCRMANGSLDAPYEGASIEAANIAEALQKAKKWAASVELADNSWLQILLDGRSVCSLKPGTKQPAEIVIASMTALPATTKK